MKRIQECLDVLEFCGAVDDVALRFRLRLSRSYNTLRSFTPDHTQTPMQRVEDWIFLPSDRSELDGIAQSDTTSAPDPSSIEYLFTIPPNPNPQLRNLSLSLLYALCRPWSDPEKPPTTVSGSQLTPESQLTADDQSQFFQRLEWDFGNVTPFRWDTDGMGMLKEGEVVAPSCFLDSEAPSGWSAAEDLEADAEGEGVV
jgi:hypothetical protein